MTVLPDPQWYKKIWTLDILSQSWVEETPREVNFVGEALQLRGNERILDLACGFGRHALALAERGCTVVGVDITPAYIEEAQRRAQAQGLNAEFFCADIRDITFRSEFDVVLNMADGAIGYLENDAENLKIFDRIAAALKPGGKHLMYVCNRDHAARHFPKRHWEMGQQALALADFDWDDQTARMLFAGYSFEYGKPLPHLTPGSPTSTRLYSVAELETIFQARGMVVMQSFGDYDVQVPASADRLGLAVYSIKRN
ncbi:MAG: class I SAM-dependent methyltransferase [Chloroflexi bacterium]|nr:class I SAM-dependent methyltransferase [Chloroflexota bacterium]